MVSKLHNMLNVQGAINKTHFYIVKLIDHSMKITSIINVRGFILFVKQLLMIYICIYI
jgi:hypothetical protein